MGSSAKKKKEKKQDFQKTKLKVGKARPKNTNATNTSFAAKAIVLKQQNLTEAGRDRTSLFSHNLSLLSSRNETQRRDALTWLIGAVATNPGDPPQPPSVIIAKAQPLILDGNSAVRQQTLKLLKALPRSQTGSLEQVLLYTRAGLTHLSADIKTSSLDFLDWLLDVNGDGIVSIAGGWVKTLQAFQNLLAWHGPVSSTTNIVNGTWSTNKTSSNIGSNKLLFRQLTTLSRLLTAGLSRSLPDSKVEASKVAAFFPIWHIDAHTLPKRSRTFGYLNLFGAPRDIESEVYDDADDRINVFVELNMHQAFRNGVQEAKKEGGEVGRAAALVDKALRLADVA